MIGRAYAILAQPLLSNRAFEGLECFVHSCVVIARSKCVPGGGWKCRMKHVTRISAADLGGGKVYFGRGPSTLIRNETKAVLAIVSVWLLNELSVIQRLRCPADP